MPVPPNTKAMDFPDIRQALDFISVCLETPHIGIERRHLDHLAVHGDKKRCAIFIDAEGLSERQRDALEGAAGQGGGGCLTSTSALDGGEHFTINSLLERIRLESCEPNPELRPDQTRTVLIAIPAPEHGRGDVLGDVYATIPKRAYGSSQYAIVEPGAANGNTKYLVLIRDVAPHFDLWAWEATHRELGPRVFYPYEPSPTCVLYVHIGRELPVRDALRLYDAEDHELVLMGEDPTGTKRETLKIRSEEHGGFFVRAHQVFDLRLARGTQAGTLGLAVPPDAPWLPMDLVAEPTPSQAREGLDEVEREIESHNKQLAQLDARRQRILRGRVSECYVAHVFHEPAPGRLPVALRRFLDQPRSVLSQYEYGFAPASGERGSASSPPLGLSKGAAHILVSQSPVNTASLLSSGADRTYVRPTEWQKWGLPLFVRRWVEMRPRIDEPDAVAPLLKRLQERIPDAAGTKGYFLAEPASEAAPMAPLRFTYVTGMRKLTDCIALLNTLAIESVRAVASQAESRHEELRDAAKVNVSKALQAFEGELLGAAAERTEAAARDWHGVRRRLEEAIERTRNTEKQLEEIEAAISDTVGSWRGYVNRVMEANGRLTAATVGAFETYRADAEETARRLDQVRKAQADADLEVKARRGEIDTKKAEALAQAQRVGQVAREFILRADEAQQEINAALEQLHAAVGDGEKRLEGIRECRERLNGMRARVEGQVIQARAAGAAAQSELDHIEAQEQEAERLQQEARNLRDQAEARKAETEAALLQADADYQAQTRRLDAIQREHEQQLNEARQRVDQMKSDADAHARDLARQREEQEAQDTEGMERLKQQAAEEQAGKLRELERRIAAAHQEALDSVRAKAKELEDRLEARRVVLREAASALGVQVIEAASAVDVASAAVDEAEKCRRAIEWNRAQAAILWQRASELTASVAAQRKAAEAQAATLGARARAAEEELQAVREKCDHDIQLLRTETQSRMEEIEAEHRRLSTSLMDQKERAAAAHKEREELLRAQRQKVEQEIAALNLRYTEHSTAIKKDADERAARIAGLREQNEQDLKRQEEALLRPVIEQQRQAKEDYDRRAAELLAKKRAIVAEHEAARAKYEQATKVGKAELDGLVQRRDALLADMERKSGELGAKQDRVRQVIAGLGAALQSVNESLGRENDSLESLDGPPPPRDGPKPPPLRPPGGTRR